MGRSVVVVAALVAIAVASTLTIAPSASSDNCVSGEGGDPPITPSQELLDMWPTLEHMQDTWPAATPELDIAPGAAGNPDPDVTGLQEKDWLTLHNPEPFGGAVGGEAELSKPPGVPTTICDGRESGALRALLSGEARGTQIG